jgi:xylulokinase
MKNRFAGLDVSTQSAKLVVIDTDQRAVIFTSSMNYDKDLPHFHTIQGTRKNRENGEVGVSESDPNMWIEAVHLLFKSLSKQSSIIPSIKGISVSGQQHGLVTLTAEGDLSRPYSKLWNDFSTTEECILLTENIGGKDNMIQQIGNTQRPGYTAPKILHMVRHEPEKYEQTATILLVHNYINWVLTGGKQGGIIAMEPGDVSGSALWDPMSKTWATEILTAISPNLRDKLPEVTESRKPIGTIGKEFVETYEFAEGCVIASGSGDNMMGAIGTGNYKEGIVTISLGTSGTAYTCMKAPFIDVDGEIACFCDALGNYLPLLCISNLANGYEAILQQFDLDHKAFNAIIDSTKPGNRGRVLLPWYEGERTPDLPEAAPIYFGFQLDDFNRETLCRAVLEGHVMNLYEGFIKLPVKPMEIRLTGGISQSRVWRETIANIFNCSVIPVLGEGAALGAALHAAWAYFPRKSIADIADPFILLDEQQRADPTTDVANVEAYKNLKKLYLALSKKIRGLPGDNPFQIFTHIKKT